MRAKRSFLYKRIVIFACAASACLLLALLALNFFKIFAEPLGDEARVNENDQLTYYITVNSDGIDHESIESSDSQIADEVSGITTVTDVLPDGLTFEGFVTSPDGSFGAVQRDDKATQCAGRVIDDTNEEGVDSGVWNADNTEYTYHGLHYDATTRKVSFRTKGIGAGCELTVGVITRTPTLPDGVFRMDFYDHAKFVDESLFGDSNTVHAWIQKDTLPGEFSLSYRYDGVVPENAPAVPQTSYYDLSNAEISIAEKPTMDGYTFEGWYYDRDQWNTKIDASTLSQLPGKSLVVYGEWVPDGGEPVDTNPEKYDVVYEIEGTKPTSFNVPAKRSYYEGASVELDDTKDGANFDGYDFSGWDSEDVDAGATTFSMPSKNVTLRGSFDRESYTVSYAYLGDVKPENADSLLPAASEHFAGDMITLAGAVSAEGYTFSGWMADPNFEMPAKDVVIYGEWVKDKIEFTPGIAIEITNPENEYHKGDVVKFKITITNEESFDLDNVWLEELLEGAVFVSGDGYSVEQGTFAKIDKVPAGGSASVYAEFEVTKNIEKLYTNEVELISADISNPDYTLPEDWENKASVDFVVGIISDLPVDPDEPVQPDEKEATPKTFDGIVRAVVSGMVLAGGLVACVYIMKNRRGGIKYGYMAGIVAVAGVTVLAINNGLSFADNNTERPELDIYSTKLNYDNKEAGAWNVHESAEWVGVGEAMLKIEVKSNKISDLHNKDVILVLDNSNWTGYAIDGTEPDDETDKLTLDIMKEGASVFAEDLLKDGDSRLIVLQTWGDIQSGLTNDASEIETQLAQIETKPNTNYNSYSETLGKVSRYLDEYLARDDINDRSLSIVYVSDDHVASSSDIAKFKMIKSKAPNVNVASIGIGNKEGMAERYISPSTAYNLGVARFWSGVDGNINPIGAYAYAVNGLDLISDWHSNPWKDQYVATLVDAIDGSLKYSKFNIETDINLADFNIKGIYGDVGDIEVSEGKITWKNEEKGFVSGMRYEMNVLLEAKNQAVEKHKLYQLNNGTNIETNATDIEADNVSTTEKIVLMNGFELSFDINNPSTCSLGDNQNGGIFFAFQSMNLDEENVSCEGWNFDSFKNEAEGLIYGAKNDKMPARDMELKATWRKVDVEVHMDGQIYSVAPAVLMDGKSFNKKAYEIGGNSSTDLLLRAEGCPSHYMDEAHRVSADDSATKIYLWRQPGYTTIYYKAYDGSDWDYSYSTVAYYCTDADTITLNEDVTGMFGYYSYKDENDNYQYLNSSYRMIDEDFANWDASNVKNMSHLFDNTYLGGAAIKYTSNWDVSNVENMDYTFYNVDFNESSMDYSDAFANWDTSNVNSMRYTFADNEELGKLGGIANWDTSNVKDMTGIFSGGSYDRIYKYDMVANWNTSNVESMEYAFGKGSWSTRPVRAVDFSDLANWDLGKVKTTKMMFRGQEIADTDAFANWNVSNVENMSEMFSETKLSNGVVGLQGWDVSKVKNAHAMFASSNLANVGPLSGWGDKTKNIEDFSYMFEDTLVPDLHGLQPWDTSGAKDMSYMFASDSEYDAEAKANVTTLLTNIEGVAPWNVSNVENMTGMFRGANPDDLQALANWNVSNVKDMAYMFCGAVKTKKKCYDTSIGKNGAVTREAFSGPKTLAGIENWDISSVENMTGIFAGGVVTDLSPISGWNTSSVKNLSYAFAGLNVGDFVSLKDWNVSNVEKLLGVFRGSKATSLNGLQNWNVSKVTAFDSAFEAMVNLSDISALTNWNTESATSLWRLLKDHKSLASLNGLQKWNVSNVSSYTEAFTGYSPYDDRGYTNWASYEQSVLSDISALENWSTDKLYEMKNIFAANGYLSDISALAGWRVAGSTNMVGILQGTGITTLDPLAHWYDNADDLGYNVRVSFQFAFAYNYSLSDVSALSNWTSSNIRVDNIASMMRSDGQVSDFTPLNNTFFNRSYSSWEKDNAFDGTSGTLPSWY